MDIIVKRNIKISVSQQNKVMMMSVRYNNKAMCDCGSLVYPYVEKGLQLCPDTEITRNVVELADSIRHKLFKKDKFVTLKELFFKFINLT